MERRGSIDRTLAERQAVQELVHRLRDSALTVQELEEIGARLKVAGDSGLKLLLRELGREEDPELLSRCAYLLDFFEEDHWLSPLMGITLRRRDLPEEGKVALLNALQEYGVDVSLPPFSALVPSSGHNRLECALRGTLSLEGEGLVAFLDEFLGYSTELQLAVMRELPRLGDERAVQLLEALLWHEDQEVVEGALAALGRVTAPAAATALEAYLADGDPVLFPQTRLSLRRLSFKGVEAAGAQRPVRIEGTYVAVPDGEGYRSLLVSSRQEDGRLEALYLQVHERRGVVAAWGGEGLDETSFEAELETFSVHEELHRVSPHYLVRLVRDALYWSRDLCYLPADFYLRRRIFRGWDLTPARYRPRPVAGSGRGLTYTEGEELALKLLGDPLFSGWVLVHRRIFELAGLCRKGEPREPILDQLCTELLAPQAPLIGERLLAVAELIEESGMDRVLVGQLVALAQSLDGYRLPYHLHPFLRHFAARSLQVAADALEDGR